ncbi:ABC transporter substrate-binding protein [Desulfovibrio ferrophilus]|nr:hypothetical protein [Desulfovibrio ferrophilus]
MKIRFFSLVLAFLCGLTLAVFMSRPGAEAESQPPPKGLTFYTTGGATTPQMPFWKAVADSAIPELDNLDVHYWKNLDDLRGVVLAGRGDLWLGHIEGFAQAAMRGAPVRLLAVTGWRKFSILTNAPNIQTLEDLLQCPAGTELAVAPPQSPAIPIMRTMESFGLPRFVYVPHEPRQLMLESLQKPSILILTPEPMTTVLLGKIPGLHVVAQVEDLFGRFTGRVPLLPIAGIAINEQLARQRPELIHALQQALVNAGQELAEAPTKGLESLPEDFEQFMTRDIVRDSLKRDIILVRPARECREIITQYLSMVLPDDNQSAIHNLPDSFFGQ